MDEYLYKALRCCVSDRKCKGCPRESTCPKNDTVAISKALALDVIKELKSLGKEVDDLSYMLYG